MRSYIPVESTTDTDSPLLQQTAATREQQVFAAYSYEPEQDTAGIVDGDQLVEGDFIMLAGRFPLLDAYAGQVLDEFEQPLFYDRWVRVSAEFMQTHYQPAP